jgi:hypothetical protein
MIPSLSFLIFVLNGLKQVTSKGCSAYEVWEGRVIIFKPKFYAYYIDSRLTWDPCLSRIIKWLLVIEILVKIIFLKKEKW